MCRPRRFGEEATSIPPQGSPQWRPPWKAKSRNAKTTMKKQSTERK